MTGDFADKYGPWAVIAGASEGIGASLADQLAARGLDLVLIARNGALLDEVASPRTRAARSADACRCPRPHRPRRDRAGGRGDRRGSTSAWSIYNAGASDRTTTFLDNELDYSLKQIKLDCIGPIALAHHFGTAMRERGRGGIVLVASLACVAGSATLAVYSAVKAFQHNFAEGLWAELAPARRRRVLHAARHDLHTGVSAHGVLSTTPKCTCCPRMWHARSSRTSATARPRGGRKQPGGGIAGLDDRPAVPRRDDERGLTGFRKPAGELMRA